MAKTIADCKVIIPKFTKEEMDKGLTNFNDLQQSRGKEAVSKQFENVLEEKNVSQQKTRKERER